MPKGEVGFVIRSISPHTKGRKKMVDLTEEIEKIKTDAKARIESAKKQATIKEHISQATEIKPRSVYIRKLWNSTASISFGDSFRSYDDKGIDNWQLMEIIEKLTPAPMYFWRDGCVSFRPYAEPDSTRADITPIYPIKIELRTCTSDHAKICYFHTLPNLETIEINIYPNNFQQFGTISGRHSNNRNQPKWSNCAIHLAENFRSWTYLKMYSSGDWKNDYQLYSTSEKFEFFSALEVDKCEV